MIIWKKHNKQQYSDGLFGYLGRWLCFRIFWNSMRSQGSGEADYVLTCRLPGIKEKIGLYETEALAKEKAESITNLWIEGSME